MFYEKETRISDFVEKIEKRQFKEAHIDPSIVPHPSKFRLPVHNSTEKNFCTKNGHHTILYRDLYILFIFSYIF